MTDITSSTAAELATLIQTKKASSVEITTAFLDRMELLNAKTNSYLHIDRSNALEQAERADQQLAAGKASSPLHGVPIAVKDNLTTTDAPTTSGSNADVISSKSITFGLIANALAIATLCCCPPESLLGC